MGGFIKSPPLDVLAATNGKDVYLSYDGTYKLTHNKWLGSDQLNLRNSYTVTAFLVGVEDV
jgi:hypothetical protein